MTTPFVPIYRQFPTGDQHNLEKQLVNYHIQTNTAVNNRTISTFQLHTVGSDDSIADGERWFPAANSTVLRDGNRLVVQVSDAALTVNHNIPEINQATRLYGTFQDGAGTWQVLPYVDVAAANNQIKISVTATQIVVTKGAGAPPSITNGIVVFEYF